jgi:hypothetical protein
MSDKWQCPNCGKTMYPFLSLHHYKFCAMTTPPDKQPGRKDDIQAEKDLEESKKLLPKPWFEDE